MRAIASNTGRGFRRGAVTGRSQVYNPAFGRWVERNTATGRFLNTKSDPTPFKGVRRER